MLKDDALMIYGQAGRLAYCRSAPVPMKGRYKVQLSIAAVGAENKPVPAAFMDTTEREFAVLRELRDIPPGEPAVVETGDRSRALRMHSWWTCSPHVNRRRVAE